MASYLTSLFDWLGTYLYPPAEEESSPHQPNTRHQHQPSPQSIPTPQNPPQYPLSPSDISRTIHLLNLATPHPLPPELLKLILSHANYDCIHYTAHSTQPINAIARSATGPPARACVVTPPLEFLGTSPSSRRNRGDFPPGRISNLTARFTGRDQGWTSDPGSGSWSWFEIGKFAAARQSSPSFLSNSGFSAAAGSEEKVLRGPVLAHNTIAGREWEEFEIVCRVDDEDLETRGGGEGDDREEEEVRRRKRELREWIKDLRTGERVCIIPMAKYGGWQCRVLKAEVDVEVEVWY